MVSVSGVSPKYGMFPQIKRHMTRLTRLTRYPITDSFHIYLNKREKKTRARASVSACHPRAWTRGGKVLIQMGAAPGNYCGPVRPTVYKSEVKAKALGMLRDGVPKKDVARRLGVSYSTVKDWCRREGVNGAEAEPDMLHEFPAWVKCKMALHGLSQNQLAKLTGISNGNLSMYLRETKMPKLDTAVKIIDALCELDGMR